MILRGNFGKLGTGQVLNLINLSRKSGILAIIDHQPKGDKKLSTASTAEVVDEKKHHAEIYFRDGWVIAACIGNLHYHLADTLYKAGKLSQRRINILSKYTETFTDQQLALAAINRGYITKDEILKAVRYHTLEIISEIMGWGEKHFEFHEDVPDLSEYVLVPVNPREVITDTARLVHERKQLVEAVPDLNLTLRFTDDPGDKFSDIELNADEWRVVGFINSNKTVRQIAQACGMDEIEIRRIVTTLAAAGIIRLDGSTQPQEKVANGFGSDHLRKLESQVLRVIRAGMNHLQNQEDLASRVIAKDMPKPPVKPLPTPSTPKTATTPMTPVAVKNTSNPPRTSRLSEAIQKRNAELMETQEMKPYTSDSSRTPTIPQPHPAVTRTTQPMPVMNSATASQSIPAPRTTQAAPIASVSQTMPTLRTTQTAEIPRESEIRSTKSNVPIPDFSHEIPVSSWSAHKQGKRIEKRSPHDVLQICPRCHQYQEVDHANCMICGFNLLDVDLIVEMTTLLPIKEIDPSTREPDAERFSGDGWLVLDFGKKQLTIEVENKLVVGHGEIETVYSVLDVTTYEGIALGVSRAHMVIHALEDGCLVIADLGSGNGTFLNKVELEPFAPYRLYDGDTIRFAGLEAKAYYIERFDAAATTTNG